MDYPRPVILQKAAHAIRDNGGPELARVFYKWTCAGADCGKRNVVVAPNELPERSACSYCGLYQVISAAGFALHKRRDRSVDWDDPNLPTLFIRKRN